MRAVSMELVRPAPVEQCAPRGDSFADTLKATLQETDAPTSDNDNDRAPAGQGDFEGAIAMLGALTTSMCAVSPPPEALGLTPVPDAVDENVGIPGAQQPGPRPGDQRIPPTVGDIPPPAPPVVTPIGDDNIAPPVAPVPPQPAPVPPTPARPSPLGDSMVPVTPLPAPASMVPQALAEATVLPLDQTQTNDAPLDRVDGGADDAPVSAARVAHQPEAVGARASAANSTAQSQEAVRSTDVPIIDVAVHHDRARSFDTTDGSNAFANDAAGGGGTEAIAILQAGITDKPAGDSMVKVARSLAQLPAVLSDIAQQARTDSSPRRVVIPLDPPALGHVTVEIIVRADSVKVSLQHADESTFNALNAQRPAIEAALESTGLHLSGFDVSANNKQRPSHMRAAARQFEALVEPLEPDGALRL